MKMGSKDKFIKSKEAAEIIFNLIPEDIQKKYEEKISGKTLTLKDRLMSHWDENGFEYTKYKRKSDLERMILYCWSEYLDKYDIIVYVFDDLFI